MTTGIPQRGRLFPNLSADLCTLRLVRAMQAIQLSRLEDPDTARILVNQAKAVRAFIEAGEGALAQATLLSLLTVELQHDACKEALTARVRAVRAALGLPTI